MTAAFSAKAPELPVNNGLDAGKRRDLAQKLGVALSSTYTLYHKTHAYHWNVTGPMFYSVHKLTDDQYQNLAAAVDEIAERIRALGMPAPIGLPVAGEMVRELAADHHSRADHLRDIAAAADAAGDVFTADMVIARIGFHEEAAWMLNALIVKDSKGSIAGAGQG